MSEKLREIRLFNPPVFCPSLLEGWFKTKGKIVELIFPCPSGTGSEWARAVNQACEQAIVVKFFLPTGFETQSPVLYAEFSESTVHPDLEGIPHDAVKLTIQLTPEQIFELSPAYEPFEFGY